MKKIITLFALCLIALSCTACIFDQRGDTTPNEPPFTNYFTVRTEEGKISREYVLFGDYSCRVTGAITNISNIKRSVRIIAKAYDSDNIVLGENSQIRNIESNESYSYDMTIQCGAKEPKTYRVTVEKP